jgi:ribosomal protein S18
MTDQTTDDATVTEPVENDTTTDATTTEQPDAAAEAAKWKSLARKHEAQAKANADAAKRLAEIEAANQTEVEKAVKEAEQRGASAARADFGQRLAAAEIKAALTGVVPDPAAIVEDLNLAKYVTDTGDVDQEAVTALRTKYQSLAAKPPAPTLHQGDKGEAKRDLDQDIAEAERSGNFARAIALKRQKAYSPK